MRGQSSLPAHLDSLLLSGNPRLIDSVCTLAAGQNDQFYQSICEYIQPIDTAAEATLQPLFNQSLKVRNRFDLSSSGAGAASLYDRSQRLGEEGKIRDALKVYYSAICFRRRYITGEIQRLRSSYRNAVADLNQGRIAEAQELIEDFRDENNSTPAYIAMKDSLLPLYSALEDRVDAEQKTIISESSRQPLSKDWTVSIQSGAIFLPTFSDHGLIFYAQNGDKYLTAALGPIPTQFHPYLGASLSYFPSATYSVDLDFLGGTMDDFTYSNNLFFRLPLSTAHVFEQFTSLYACITAFLRSTTGPRIFFRFGGGEISVKRSEVELQSIFASYLPIAESKRVMPELHMEAGCDYETDPLDLLTYRISISYDYNFQHGDLVEASLFRLILGIALNIR